MFVCVCVFSEGGLTVFLFLYGQNGHDLVMYNYKELYLFVLVAEHNDARK